MNLITHLFVFFFTTLSVKNMSKSTGALFSNKEQLKRRHKDDNLNDIDTTFDDSSNKYKKKEQGATQNKKDWRISILLTIWTSYIRLWKLSQPSSVV